MKLGTDHVDALLVALLATYSYPLDKAWALRERLRSAGLCEPRAVAAKDTQEVGNLLKRAGYDRGGITYIIAPRVIELMRELDAGLLDGLADLAAANDGAAFKARLERVKGFGPKSSELAWALAGGP